MADQIDFSKLDPTKLEEYGQSDPAWRAVNDHLNAIPTVTEFVFLGRMTDTFIFVRDLLEILHAAHRQIVRRMMHGIPEMVQQYIVPESPKEALDFLTRALEFQFQKKVGQYEPWLLNQGLAMFCTILDVFWEHVVDVIYRKHVELLYRPDESRTLQLRDVVRLASVEAVVADFRQKEVRRFGYLDTDKRLAYLQSRCRIETAKIFDWSHYTQEVQDKLRGFDAKTLRSIYDDRHSIVHNDKLPVADLAALERIKEFFDKIILNTALEAKDKQDVLLETNRFLMLQPLYESFKAKMDQGRPTAGA